MHDQGTRPTTAGSPSVDGPALASFVVLGALGSVLGWSARDLVWGLLLLSFVTCLLAVVLGLQSVLRQAVPEILRPWPDQKPGTVVMLALLLGGCAFGGFVFSAIAIVGHVIYAFVIYSWFPLWPEQPNPLELSSAEQWRMLFAVPTTYWPFALFALARDRAQVFRPLWDPRPLDFLRPWLPFLRMHLFLFIAAGVARSAGTGLAFYWVVLLVFFFPWDALALRERARGWWSRVGREETAAPGESSTVQAGFAVLPRSVGLVVLGAVAWVLAFLFWLPPRSFLGGPALGGIGLSVMVALVILGRGSAGPARAFGPRLVRALLPALAAWPLLTVAVVATNALGPAQNETVTAEVLRAYERRDDGRTQHYADVRHPELGEFRIFSDHRSGIAGSAGLAEGGSVDLELRRGWLGWPVVQGGAVQGEGDS